MSSIEELKVIRLYRAFNTVIRMCHNRGYTVRHPSVIANVFRDPTVYDAAGDGLSYTWFVEHFVSSPRRVITGEEREEQEEGNSGTKAGTERNKASSSHTGSRPLSDEWTVMRGALRLTCTSTNSASNQSGTDAEAGEESKGGAATATAASSESLMVFFSPNDVLGVKEVLEYREKALQKKATSMIVVATRINPAVRRDVQELSGRINALTGKMLLPIQLFEEDALVFDVMMHETVQRHHVLSKEEADALLRTRQLTLSQLPRMLVTDPVVQYLGLARGDIVRIRRESKESGPYDMYRLVI